MNPTISAGARARRVGYKIAFGVTLFASLGVAYAFKTIFARPGEAALRFVPADAMMVGTLDLSPSPAQALAFKHIDDAMDRNGMNRFVETSVLDIFSKKSAATDLLRPLVQRSGAIALLPYKTANGETGGTSGLALIALSSGTEAEAILKKYGKPTFFRGTKGYTLPGDKSTMMVMDDVLVLGEKPYSLHAARMVRDGQTPGILSSEEFQTARQHVSSDANVMMFCSPKLLGDTGVAALKDAKASWLGAGLAIRDGGVGLSVWNRFDPNSVKGLAEFGQTQAIRRDLFGVLPTGAYGMFAISQPGNYFEMFERSMGQEKDGQQMIADMSKGMHEAIGVDLHKDLVAGLKGNAVIAAYPAADGAPEGAEALLVIDDLNGSDPAAVVDRFQAYVDEQMAKEGGTEKIWVETKSGDNRMFRIADKMQDEMRKGIGEGMDERSVKKEVLVGKKTIAWAMVGKAVIASTNEALLARAVDSFKNRTSTLSSDARFIKSDSEVMDGSQVLAVFNLGRIAEGVKNTISTEKMDKDGAEMFNTVLSAFANLTDPFYLKAKVGADGEVASGAFIPLDYDKVFDFIGKEMKGKG
ncbi:MAG: DUF3352 domain-containing protein [Fimbriimonas sp.]